MRRLILVALFVLCGPQRAYPETTQRAMDLANACSYFGEALPKTVTVFKATDEAQQLIHRIVDASGLVQNFQALAAPVPNASAVTMNGVRFVLYNTSFISEITSKTRNKWAPISIMAHEVGHHLNGHTIGFTGSRPPLELEADFFSGFILQRLGASLVDAKAAMEQLGSPTGSATHPGKEERLAAIATGWNKACEKDPDCFRDSDSDKDLEIGPEKQP